MKFVHAGPAYQQRRGEGRSGGMAVSLGRHEMLRLLTFGAMEDDGKNLEI